MRCAYSGGALVALAKELRVTRPDIAIGISGGAGSLAYYLSEQYEDIEKIWTELLATDKFISFGLKNPILNIDYLIDTIFKERVPFNIEKFKTVLTEWAFPVLDIHDQKQSRFFSKSDSVDIFELLRASMAVPVVYGKQIILGKFKYRDGDLGLSVEDTIEKARSLGATHIIVIENNLESLRVKLIDKFFKKLFMKSFSDAKKKEDAPRNIIRIQNIHSPAGLLTHDKKRLRATFDKGYSDIINHPELPAFLSQFHSEV